MYLLIVGNRPGKNASLLTPYKVVDNACKNLGDWWVRVFLSAVGFGSFALGYSVFLDFLLLKHWVGTVCCMLCAFWM